MNSNQQYAILELNQRVVARNVAGTLAAFLAQSVSNKLNEPVYVVDERLMCSSCNERPSANTADRTKITACPRCILDSTSTGVRDVPPDLIEIETREIEFTPGGD